MATYTLRDMAQNAGWQVNYDQPTNKVTVINPATKQSISFLSGQGQEYGLGGLINGANVVKDTIKLGSFLTNPQLPTPTQVNTGGIATPSSNNTQGVGGIGNTTGNTKDLGTSQGTPQGIPNTGTPQGIPQGTPQGTGQVTAANALQGSAIPQPPQMTDYSKELEALKQAQIARITGNLTSKYNQTVADINSNINKVAPTYDAKRLQTQSDSQLQAKNFAEFLANRGLSRSGTSQQAELNRNMQLQQAFNQYDKQQADDMAYYQKQLDDARSAYNRDKYNAEQQAESDYLSQLIQTKAKQDEIRNANYWKQYEAERQAKIDERNKQQDEYNFTENKRKDAENAFINSMKGLGDQFDYQAEIDKITNDGDPSNDWQINILKQERQKKLDALRQKEIETIGQYSNDYQAEINKRQQSQDPTDDYLIPYLKTARMGKLDNMLKDEVTGINQYYNDFQAEINRRKETPDTLDDRLIPFLQQAKRKKEEEIKSRQQDLNDMARKTALDVFKQTGIVNSQEMANLLGVPIGTTTTDYAKNQYDISKPYFKATTQSVSPPKTSSSNTAKANTSSNKMTTSQRNQSMADDIAQLQNRPVADAIQALEENKQLLISTYGISGYKQIWNTALDKAIRVGQARPYGQ